MMKKILSYVLNFRMLFILMLLINLCVILHHFNNKAGFHSDEQWSYAHANSTKGAYLDKNIDSFYKVDDSIKNRLFYNYIDARVLHDYLSVQKDETFSYQNIYNNLKIVEHPPLYFLLLHTISSFFPDSFNKYHAGLLNLVLFILIYVVLYKLSFFILKDEKLALCSTALYGFSEIGIDTVIFLRMYVLQTLCSLCLLYETIKIIKNNHATKSQLVLISLYSFLGIFTHYNALFFSFFVTLSACLIFLKLKNYKLMLQFGAMMALSVVMLFIIFPQAYDVLFGSLRGTQVLSNIMNMHKRDTSGIISLLYGADIRMSYLLEMISEHFFIFNRTYYKLIAFVFIMGVFLSLYLRAKISSPVSFLLITLALYLLYLLSMPYMRLFHSRYYMSIMPLLAVLFVLALSKILNYLKLKKNVITLIIGILVGLNSLGLDFARKSPYSFRYNDNEYAVLEKIKNNDVFIDSGDKVIALHSMAYYMKNAKRIYISEDICDLRTLRAIKESSHPVVFTYASYILSDVNIDDIFCLEEIGLRKIAKICASQHCYNAWQKAVNE